MRIKGQSDTNNITEKKVRICQQQWNDIQHKNEELKKRMKEIETNIELYTRKKQKWIAMILKSHWKVK